MKRIAAVAVGVLLSFAGVYYSLRSNQIDVLEVRIEEYESARLGPKLIAERPQIPIEVLLRATEDEARHRPNYASMLPMSERIAVSAVEDTGSVARIGDIIGQGIADMIERPYALLIPLLIGVAYYLITVVGIMMGSIYEALEGNTDPNKSYRARDIAKMAFSSGSWQGIIASPLIFALIKGAMPTDGITFGMSMLAFENGFFWRSTMKRITDRRNGTK